MALTGKDVLDALGIDESHQSDIGLPGAESTVSLRQEGVLIDLQYLAKRTRTSVNDVAVLRHNLKHMIDAGRSADERNGFNELPEPFGAEVRFALQGIYAKLEALLDRADEA